MKMLKGVFPALPTPFSKDGKVNGKALESLILKLLGDGVDGFYVGGSTAEAFLLTEDERKYIIDVAADTAGGKVPLICQIGSISTDRAVELAKHAEKRKAAAVSSVPPFYFKFTFDEIKGYYFEITDSVSLPMIIYNIPVYSGISFSFENINEFFSDKRFIGIKHTSNDFFMLERIKSSYPEKTAFNGYDEMFLAGLSMGADGGIGSTYNFMPDKFIGMRELFLRGDMASAHDLQTEANAVIAELIKVGVLPGLKELLRLSGFDFGDCRKPFRQLTGSEKDYFKSSVYPLIRKQ